MLPRAEAMLYIDWPRAPALPQLCSAVPRPARVINSAVSWPRDCSGIHVTTRGPVTAGTWPRVMFTLYQMIIDGFNK